VQRARERFRLPRWDKQSAFGMHQGVLDAADGGRDDRQTVGRCLEQRVRRTFGVRRQHGCISRCIETLGRRHEAGPPDRVGHARPCGPSKQTLTFWTLTSDDQSDRKLRASRPEQRHGVDEIGMAFFP